MATAFTIVRAAAGVIVGIILAAVLSFLFAPSIALYSVALTAQTGDPIIGAMPFFVSFIALTLGVAFAVARMLDLKHTSSRVKDLVYVSLLSIFVLACSSLAIG